MTADIGATACGSALRASASASVANLNARSAPAMAEWPTQTRTGDRRVDGDESPRLGWDRGGVFSNITISRSRGYVEFNCVCGLGLSPGVRSGVRDEPGRQGPDEPTV